MSAGGPTDIHGGIARGCLRDVRASVLDRPADEPAIVVQEGDAAIGEFEKLSETIVLEQHDEACDCWLCRDPESAEPAIEQVDADAETSDQALLVTIPRSLAQAVLIEVEINKLAALRRLQDAGNRAMHGHWSQEIDRLRQIANQLRDAIAAAHSLEAGISVTSPARLREERLRLDLNQTDFGALGGVRKRTQIMYEKGYRSPKQDYLARIAAAGVDVGYVITGTRTRRPA